jgi:hypothetical protein
MVIFRRHNGDGPDDRDSWEIVRKGRPPEYFRTFNSANRRFARIARRMRHQSLQTGGGRRA